MGRKSKTDDTFVRRQRKTLGRISRRWKDNSKMNLNETGVHFIGLMQFVIAVYFVIHTY
jgi:hypothetical protein